MSKLKLMVTSSRSTQDCQAELFLNRCSGHDITHNQLIYCFSPFLQAGSFLNPKSHINQVLRNYWKSKNAQIWQKVMSQILTLAAHLSMLLKVFSFPVLVLKNKTKQNKNWTNPVSLPCSLKSKLLLEKHLTGLQQSCIHEEVV